MKETDTDYSIKFYKRFYYNKNSISFMRYPDYMYMAEIKNPYSSLCGNRVFEIEELTKSRDVDGTWSIDILFRSNPKLLDYDYSMVKEIFDYDRNCLAFYVSNNFSNSYWRDRIFTIIGDSLKLINTTLRCTRIYDSDEYYTLSGIIVPEVVEDIDRSSIIPNQMIDMTLPTLLPKPRTKDEKWPTKPSTAEMDKEDIVSKAIDEMTLYPEKILDHIHFNNTTTTRLFRDIIIKSLKKVYGDDYKLGYKSQMESTRKLMEDEMKLTRVGMMCLELKDIKFSGDKTIAFWEDGEKTIVTMQDDEKQYDPEKAIMACYMKRLIDIQKQVTNHNISIKKIFDKYLAKYEKEKPKIEAQIQKIKQRKANKKENTK